MADLADVLVSYAEYLKPQKRQYKHFLNVSKTNPEAAAAEAVTFGILQQCGAEPVIADLPGKGGPDFKCLPNKPDQFMVEATSFQLGKISKDTGLANYIPEEIKGEAYSLLTKQIHGKACDKMEQLQRAKLPAVLAIASDHIHAPLVLNSQAAFIALASEPFWIGDGPNMTVDFKWSAFLERDANGHVVVKHPALSAIILIAITSRQSMVCGALNPKAAYPFRSSRLYQIPFAYLKDWPIENSVARCEWTMGNTGACGFPHTVIKL